MSKEYRVGSVAAVLAGETGLVDVNGTELALFVADDKIVVTQGQCPHAQGPIHQGEVEDCILTCPWHGWSFDLLSGQCNEDDSMQLKIYPIRIDGDDILVTL